LFQVVTELFTRKTGTVYPGKFTTRRISITLNTVYKRKKAKGLITERFSEAIVLTPAIDLCMLCLQPT
jgi:hypothetical protein